MTSNQRFIIKWISTCLGLGSAIAAVCTITATFWLPAILDWSAGFVLDTAINMGSFSLDHSQESAMSLKKISLALGVFAADMRIYSTSDAFRISSSLMALSCGILSFWWYSLRMLTMNESGNIIRITPECLPKTRLTRMKMASLLGIGATVLTEVFYYLQRSSASELSEIFLRFLRYLQVSDSEILQRLMTHQQEQQWIAQLLTIPLHLVLPGIWTFIVLYLGIKIFEKYQENLNELNLTV